MFTSLLDICCCLILFVVSIWGLLFGGGVSWCLFDLRLLCLICYVWALLFVAGLCFIRLDGWLPVLIALLMLLG